MPHTMKAALIHSFNGIEKIEIKEISVPIPQDTEIQISVKYAGVNPVDWKIAEGLLKTRMDYEFPITLGWDVAGVVSAIGKGVKHFKEGDPVFAYCRKAIVHDGSFADFICLEAENVVHKPHKLSFAEAASIPLCSLTAWQSLFDTANLKSKEWILIQGGAGGVGSFAIQFAKMAGAHIITTASSSNFDYLKLLGADELIDYNRENVLERIHKLAPQGVDVLLDTVGGDTLKASYDMVKQKGRLVTIAGIVDQAVVSQKQIKGDFVFVSPNGEELKKIAALLDSGKIQPPRIQEMPFDQIEAALRKAREGHAQGKLVLKVN